MSILNASHFHSEEAAYAFVEAHIWPDGRFCPHCGTVDQSGKLAGKSTRIGTYKCYACRKPFTVKVRTIFEASHVKLHIWLQAMFLLCSSKKGISANQLHRTLGVTLKTAWFMAHRIREAMKDNGDSGPLGGEGNVVGADETFTGPSTYKFINEKGCQKKKNSEDEYEVPILVERGGKARSIEVDELSSKSVGEILFSHTKPFSILTTVGARYYRLAGRKFAEHLSVNHRMGEHARAAGHITTNAVEGFFSIFKHGMKGIYQHCGE
jgi:transposase-like protein